MCGIVGFVGNKPAKNFLLTGLKRMEYRGYDSAGLVTVEDGSWQLTRVKGKVDLLRKKARNTSRSATSGIGHTRWATHGKPSIANAHPHVAHKIAIVHNGIIENHNQLRQELEAAGVVFRSETDSEVLAWLIEQAYQSRSLEQAVLQALKRTEGAFGMAVIALDTPGKVIVARRSSPIAIGQTKDGVYIASDASALAGYSKEIIYLDDNQIAVCTPENVEVKTFTGAIEHPAPVALRTDVASLQKGGHQHYLIKEILEQPVAVQSVLSGRIAGGRLGVQLGGLNLTSQQMRGCQQITIVGCGTAYYAGLYAKYILENLLGIPVAVEVASEFRYRNAALPQSSIGIAVSQSGETADTLAAVKELRRRAIPVVGIVNVVGSSIAREVEGGVYLHAGPEISVASTKAFTTQVAAMLLFGISLASHRKQSGQARKELLRALESLPAEIDKALELKTLLAKRVSHWKNFEHAFYLGRDRLYPIALEGSHKLKEISYIHAEAYPGGEMKHGANALLDEKLLTVFLLGKGRLYEKSLSNLAEVQARSGHVLVVTNSEEYARENEDALFVPTSSDWTAPLVMNIVLQLIAYYVAKARHCAIDQPRNLAKSVTVE